MSMLDVAWMDEDNKVVAYYVLCLTWCLIRFITE